jgi:transposase
MVRNYVRKTNRAPGLTEGLRRRAIQSIGDGMSVRKTAECLGVPLSTLRDNLRKVSDCAN